MTSTQAPPARLAMVTLDCAEPAPLAEFWAGVLGGQVAHSEDDYAMVVAGGTTLGFGRVDGYVPPSWPDEHGAKQFHLDLAVEDMASAEATIRDLGATAPEHQPGAERWRVLLDPAGHPFCLSPASSWS